MALQKTSVFVPLGGALDSQKAPLSMPSTSLLTCDNVTQERRGEFRRRYGFTQVAGDSLAGINASCPSQVATVGQGPTGQSMVALMDTNQLVKFDTAKASWTAQTPLTPRVSTMTRAALAMSNDLPARLAGFASDGTEFVCATSRITGPVAGANQSIYAVWGKVSSPALDNNGNLIGTVVSLNVVRCAALPGFLCIFSADTSGNLVARVRNTSTGVISSTTVKAGLDTATPLLDAMYYTGSTITLVMRMAGAPSSFQRIEFNPSTLANASDDTVAISNPPTLLSLIADPSNSGRRFVGLANGGSTNTSVVSLLATGVAVNNWQLEAIQATQLTGCMKGISDGAFVYQVQAPTANTLKRNTVVAGVVGTARFLDNTIVGIVGSIASNGWGVSGDTMWYFTVVQNKSSATDFQQTAIVQANTFTDAGINSSDNVLIPMASLAPLGSGPTPTTALYQAMNIGTRTFAVGMPVATLFSLTGGVVTGDYVISSFTQVLTTASDSLVNIGQPAYRNGKPIFPGESLCTVEGTYLLPIGMFSPPQQPSLSQAGGGSLTPLATYQYAAVVETVTQDGLVWRGPATVSALITLTGANQTVGVTVLCWQTESFYQFLRIKFYRSQANGSVPTLIKVIYADGASMAAGSWGIAADTAADNTITAGEILYTVGEQPNMCWPPSSHVWIFDDRLWAVNRDYRTEIQYSKNLQATRQPETTLANVVDLDDQWGDVTGGSSVEGRGVIFKRNAIYFVQGDGLTDAGSGNNYTVTRISDDIGALPGTPLVNAGDAIYFVSQRGIHSVDAAGNIRFVGKGIDAWVNQPQVNTPETFYDGVFVPSKNEVRFVTTNYVFVYDRKFPDQDGVGQWIRWTGLSGMRRCLLVNDQMVLFKTDGTVWREGTSAQTTDQGVAFTGTVRTGWIRPSANGLVPAPVQQGMRVYDGRVVFTRIAGGGSITATAKLYFNDDDSSVQTFTSQAIAGATLTDVGEFFPTTQKCTSCSVEVNLPSGDATMRVQGVSLNVGIRAPSEQRRPAGEKWS